MERVFIMDKTTRIADVLLKNQKAETVRYGIRSDKYQNPELISTCINEKIRKEKDQEQELWAELLVKVKFEYPSATDNKLHAIVFKQI